MVQILQYLEQEKQTLKEREEQWLEERAKIQGTIPADGNKQDGRGEIVESLEPTVEEKTAENTAT